jgi:hypothetical protein
MIGSWRQRHPLRGPFAVAFCITWGGIGIVLSTLGFDFKTPRPIDTCHCFVAKLPGPSVSVSVILPATSPPQSLIWQSAFAAALWITATLVFRKSVRPVETLSSEQTDCADQLATG